MKILVPLLTGKEKNKAFLETISTKVDEVVLLQIVDKDFMSRTTSALGEVRQSSAVMGEVKKILSSKKKRVTEVAEWGATIQKIVAISVLQKIDKVFLVKQENQFFEDIIKELKKQKVPCEVLTVVEETELKKK